MRKEQYIENINRALDGATREQLELVYKFVWSVCPYPPVSSTELRIYRDRVREFYLKQFYEQFREQNS